MSSHWLLTNVYQLPNVNVTNLQKTLEFTDQGITQNYNPILQISQTSACLNMAIKIGQVWIKQRVTNFYQSLIESSELKTI